MHGAEECGFVPNAYDPLGLLPGGRYFHWMIARFTAGNAGQMITP